MNDTGSRAGLFWSAAGGMFVFGIVLAILGALFGLPAMRERLAINLAQQGDIFLLLFFGVFLATVFVGPAIDTIGHKWVLTLSAALVAAGLLLVAAATSYAPALAGAFILGFGGGGLNTSCNALVSDVYPEKRGTMLNLLGVFFGVGALFIPLLTAVILDYVGPVQLLQIAAVLATICFVAYAILKFPPARESGAYAPLGILKVAGYPGVLLIAFLLFFQSGNESSIGGWTSTYVGSMGADARAATWVLSAYWGAMMVGRILGAKLLEKMTKPALVLASAIGSAAGALVLLLSASIAMMAAGAVIVGLSFAAIYPTVLAIAGDRYQHNAGSIFGLLFAIGLLGGMAFPWALGHISQAIGIRYGMILPIVGATMIAVLVSVIAAKDRKPAVAA
ncbi:MAG TPA: MFS transporter [Thermoanaerobaculia bacterium]